MPTNLHPAQQLTLSFLPKILVNICHGLVEKHHQAFGYSCISTYLWHRDTNAFIAIHKDLFTFMYNATILWRFRNLCVVVAIILIVLGIFVNGWIVLGLIPIFV